MIPLSITLITDIICPWCFIGSRRLTQVADEIADRFVTEVTHQPFLLDPSTPPEGDDLRDRLRRKYGVDPERLFGRVEAAARATGIALDFSRVRRTPPTLPAHTLLRHAQARGTQRALVDALYSAYFLEGRDIGQPDVLADLAAAHGFSADEAVGLVTAAAELARTRADAQQAVSDGVTGVPYFIVQNRVAFSGAQPAEVFHGAIAQALELEGPEAGG